MDECDIAAWVQGAPDAVQRELRQAVHTVLVAIGGSSDLQAQMVMKGGILLAIRYESSRYTGTLISQRLNDLQILMSRGLGLTSRAG